MLKRFVFAVLAMALFHVAPAVAAPSNISQTVGVCDPGYPQRCVKPNADGTVSISGTISASQAAFAPTGQAARSVSTTSARVALASASPTAVVQNLGSVTAYVVFGDVTVVSTTSTGYPITAGGTVAFAVGTNTYIAAITATSTSTLSITTGTGVPAVAGAGSGSSSGGATVTANATSPTYVEGSSTNPLSTDLHGGLRVLNMDSSGNVLDPNAALPAGTNIIGKVGIDQTTDGTTNGVHLVAGTAIAGKVGIDQTTDGTTNRVSANLSQVNGTTALTGGVAGSQGVGGLAANNATASGNPVQQSCIAVSAEATLATAAQNASCVTDLAHKQIVAPYTNPENIVTGTTAAMTGTTSTSLVAAPGSGLRNYITYLTCVNSHATVGTFVTIQDGSGGTALMTLAAAAVYGGQSAPLAVPLRQPTANTALFVADVTTGANVICSAVGYKGQ